MKSELLRRLTAVKSSQPINNVDVSENVFFIRDCCDELQSLIRTSVDMSELRNWQTGDQWAESTGHLSNIRPRWKLPDIELKYETVYETSYFLFHIPAADSSRSFLCQVEAELLYCLDP
jgi:hypothetical protein